MAPIDATALDNERKREVTEQLSQFMKQLMTENPTRTDISTRVREWLDKAPVYSIEEKIQLTMTATMNDYMQLQDERKRELDSVNMQFLKVSILVLKLFAFYCMSIWRNAEEKGQRGAAAMLLWMTGMSNMCVCNHALCQSQRLCVVDRVYTRRCFFGFAGSKPYSHFTSETKCGGF